MSKFDPPQLPLLFPFQLPLGASSGAQLTVAGRRVCRVGFFSPSFWGVSNDDFAFRLSRRTFARIPLRRLKSPTVSTNSRTRGTGAGPPGPQ
ncbi:hypothetical protein TGMAS_360190 [Toxoplasma gondii MAS]|uniref:Uncharacterized protein n=4 Tax=Toxoplasma gondii TaxID=5811 RepID=A0A2G8Y849_TOXGO|nr:hypothetical protein TGFOU_360190 [Toxoplasma gondii FOU]KFH17604.1 hypothetical protein TGMAS_360190 [Toxoplasma gondii MAS]PIM03440.1 hypothetical protein TGCOUG_360190 [Toxoplasma gondii COUG]PUA92913.1 hypothetical protein TGBR9_360190 [Toxoplasma gondii TgCATBr9]